MTWKMDFWVKLRFADEVGVASLGEVLRRKVQICSLVEMASELSGQ